MIEQQKKLFVISGPSGVGKGTVVKSLLEHRDDIKLSISYTTRSPRTGEINGVNYFFISADEFLKDAKNGEFLEWAEFSGNYYGTKKSFVLDTLKNYHVLLEIDTQGALQIKEKLPAAILMFIAPPSYKELELRLRGRHTDSETDIRKRLELAKLEKNNSLFFDYIIINTTVLDTVNYIEDIIG